MKRHELETAPEFFGAVDRGEKTFEIRENDRAFAVGDELLLREWNARQGYSGREVLRRVSYVTDFMQVPGFVVLGLALTYEAAPEPELSSLADLDEKLAGALALVVRIDREGNVHGKVVRHADDLRPLAPDAVFWLRPPRVIERALAATRLLQTLGVQIHAYPVRKGGRVISAEIKKTLVELVEKVDAEAHARGFKLGLLRGAEGHKPPTGRCPHCRETALEWCDRPAPCGCRDCRCTRCDRAAVVRCVPCDLSEA